MTTHNGIQTMSGGIVALLIGAAALAHAQVPQAPAASIPPPSLHAPVPSSGPDAPLVFAGSDSFAPWEYLNERKEPSGFTVALVHALARHTGRPIIIKLMPWPQVLAGLERGTVDLAALGGSDLRRRRYDLLSLIWTLQESLVGQPGRISPIPKRVADLATEVVVVQQGTVMHELLLDLPEASRPPVLLAAGPRAALREVIAGRATLSLGNGLAQRRAAADLGEPPLPSRDVKATAYHFATGRGRAPQFAWLEPALAQLNENGTFSTLFEQHITAASPPAPWSASALIVIAGGMLCALAGGIGWYRRMRRVVASKVQAEAISARRRAEAEDALRATERQMQQLVHSVKAIVWRMDAVTERFTFVSQEAEQLLGYPVTRWTDDGRFFQAMLHADDRDWVVRYCRRATQECRDHTMEYRVFSQDGRIVWLRDIVSVIVEEGAPRELIGVMVDISEYKAAEEALEAAHAQALAATRAKSEFLASMSHEIRTPMNAVIGITDLLLDSPLTTEQRQLIETVRSSGDILLNVINDILDFSKVESGKLEFEHIGLDAEALSDDVARLMGERATAKGLDLTCRIAADVPRNLIGDPGRLRQVLLNLVGNAIKFTEKGDVAIRVTAQHVTDGQAVLRFEVSDTGIGIPTQAQGRLFDAFTQADASTTRRFGGTGLGLAISRRIIELLGGHIGLDSTPGVGTTFWFTVPCARAGAVPAGAEVSTLGGMRVLVVDDSRASRVMLEQTLLDAGVSVQVAGSADEASALLEAGPWPQVTLVDEGLADGGGAALIERLRAEAPHPCAVVLLASRLSGAPATMERTSRLTKPVRRSELLAELQRLARPAVADVAAPPVLPARPRTSANAARVLVAEDNPVNQQVARLMLEKCGCRVDVVDNGALAVESVASGAYDLVLMDCQMPVCDGFEATRRIRALPAPANAIVIVALTANALAGDREYCLAAGMNDYLAKPVRREALAEIFSRYLPDTAHAHTAA